MIENLINDFTVTSALITSCVTEIASDTGLLTFAQSGSISSQSVVSTFILVVLPALPVIFLIFLLLFSILVTLIYNIYADVTVIDKLHILTPAKKAIKTFGDKILDIDLMISLMSSVSNLFLLLMIYTIKVDNSENDSPDYSLICDAEYPYPECYDVTCQIEYEKIGCIMEYSNKETCEIIDVEGFLAGAIIFNFISGLLLIAKNKNIKYKEQIVETIAFLLHLTEHIVLLALSIMFIEPWEENCKPNSGTIGEWYSEEIVCSVSIITEYGMSDPNCQCDYFLTEKSDCAELEETYRESAKSALENDFRVSSSMTDLIIFLVVLSSINRVLLILHLVKKRNMKMKQQQNKAHASVGIP